MDRPHVLPRLLAGTLFSAALFGCGATAGTPSPAPESTGAAADPLVSLAWQVSDPSNGRASQTSTIVNHYPNDSYTTLVAFDADYQATHFTGTPLLSYTATTETVCPGASRVGLGEFSSANAAGSGTTYSGLGSIPNPPSTWPVFLGSTTIGQVEGSPNVFLGTLAIPLANMPKDGSCATGNSVAGLVGGACIMRSLTGGPPGTMPNFSLTDTDCIHTPAFDAWDSMDIVGSQCNGTSGNVYAAFHNPRTHQIDFFMASGAGGPFIAQPPPFPGGYITDPPRMVDDGRCGVHLVAGGRDSVTALFEPDVYWAEFFPQVSGNQGVWTGPAPLAGKQYWGTNNVIPAGPGTNGQMRIRAQYGLINGSQPGTVFVTYTHVLYGGSLNVTPIGTELRTSECVPPGPAGACFDVPIWSYTPPSGTWLFNPAMAAAVVTQVATAPLTEAKVTWMESTAASGVVVYSAALGDGTNDGLGLLHRREEAGWNGTSTFPSGPNNPCPTRLGVRQTIAGDWDPFDAHLGVYQATPSSDPMFVRAFIDSSSATCSGQGTYTSTPVAVSATNILWP